jgi:hypothetical protein
VQNTVRQPRSEPSRSGVTSWWSRLLGHRLAVPAAAAVATLVIGVGAGQLPTDDPAGHAHPLGAGNPAIGISYAGLHVDTEVCGYHFLAVDAGSDRDVVSCAHLDAAPPGVDVRVPATTAELKARSGASLAAVKAANSAGVPTPASYASGPAVSCDGDGQSGYRAQAMYVVEAGQTNRFSAVVDSIKQWAAGVDDVFNRSAASRSTIRPSRACPPRRSSPRCCRLAAHSRRSSGSPAAATASSARRPGSRPRSRVA